MSGLGTRYGASPYGQAYRTTGVGTATNPYAQAQSWRQPLSALQNYTPMNYQVPRQMSSWAPGLMTKPVETPVTNPYSNNWNYSPAFNPDLNIRYQDMSLGGGE